MSGKSYTMREMKSIVDYLSVNHLYSETKGRKMWMDFANSNLTIRTWQSLKETFLKRILPDITNPYYRLDPDQILSFKRGINLTEKDKKLTLQPVHSPKNNGTNDDSEQPNTSKKDTEENVTGEDTQCSKIVHNRASTETLILDTCYQTAEDMKSDSESANEERNTEKADDKLKPALKSVRDFIEYSEPLTPMLQEVMDDFATDEDCSDIEPPMQIDENYVAQDDVLDPPENPSSSQSILKPSKTQNSVKATTAGEKDYEKQAGNVRPTSENNEEPVEVPGDTAFSQLEDVMVLVDEALAKDTDKELSTRIESQDKQANSNESIPLTDSLLPNNQEGIKNDSTVEVQSPVILTPHGKGEQEKRKKESQDKSMLETNLISDEELEQKNLKGPVTIDSNEDRPKLNENQDVQSGPKEVSPKKASLKDDKVHEIASDNSIGNRDIDQVENPCLKSVSLYDEKLVTTLYSDSDSNNKENTNDKLKVKPTHSKEESKKDKGQNIAKTNENKTRNYVGGPSNTKTTDGVIFLNSRTTSESVDDTGEHHRPLARSSLKKQKDKKLASVFGFSNGGAPKSRRINGRKRTTSHRKMQSDSSEWTSTSDSEYVSPPHGRRNRYARKYLKPRAARIMSLEEEGGLFVMLGKKVYPLVKDGKVVKNYVTYLPDSDPEEDDSYWKSKYIEERKRTDELKKKLGNSKSNGVMDKDEKESSISLSSVTSPLNENRPNLPPSRQESFHGADLARRYSGIIEKPNKETLKIKFTKNDQEVQLEGHWQHINPVLAQVVSILRKDSEKKPETVTCVELSSGNTTPTVTPTVAPLDIRVHDKVNEMESAIFKEIEEKDKTNEDAHEVVEPEEIQQNNIQDENVEQLNTAQENVEGLAQVTQRKKRGRPKKEISPALEIAQSPAKKPRKSIAANKIVEEVKTIEINDSTPNTGRLTRSPRKLLNGITPQAKRTRKPSAKAQAEAPVEIPATPAPAEINEDEVRYKFPSPEPETRTKATSVNKNTPKKQ